MTPKNLRKKLPSLLSDLYAGDLVKGEVYDSTLELVEFITNLLIKQEGLRCEHLVHIYGLEDDVMEGLPDDSLKILSYNFATNIVQEMFRAKQERKEETDRRVRELLEENLHGNTNVKKLH